MLARIIAQLCDEVECLLLRGELGAGKTAFARAFIESLAMEYEEVVSPTFTLVQEYAVQLAAGMKANVNHMDLYRIRDAAELREIGLEHMLDESICLIEWPDIIPTSLLPHNRLEIAIDFADEHDMRVITLHPYGKWQNILDFLRETSGA